MKRQRLTAKQREELYIVGSVVWFANGTMATRCLAEGDRAMCETFAQTAGDPIEPSDIVDPCRPARMLVITKADWLTLISAARAADLQEVNGRRQ